MYILGRNNKKKLIQIVGEKAIINGSTVCSTMIIGEKRNHSVHLC